MDILDDMGVSKLSAKDFEKWTTPLNTLILMGRKKAFRKQSAYAMDIVYSSSIHSRFEGFLSTLYLRKRIHNLNIMYLNLFLYQLDIHPHSRQITQLIMINNHN